ncbi:MAG: hypothetical protein R2777_08670 [Chitinophagales bacterium]
MTYIKLMKFWFSILLVLMGVFGVSQVPVLTLQQDTFLLINSTNITNKNGEILSSYQGNILFEGNSTNYKNIIYSLAIDSLNQQQKGIIYNGKGKISPFSIKENVVYYNYNAKDLPLAQFVNNGETWAVYSAVTDSLLFYTPTTQVNPTALFGTLNAYIAKYNLINKLKTNASKINANQNRKISYIYPLNQNAPTWVWDGTYLYPYGANRFSNLVWKFEEDRIKSCGNFPRTQEEWRWDGSSLKKALLGKQQLTNGHGKMEFYQIWNNNYKNEYIMKTILFTSLV